MGAVAGLGLGLAAVPLPWEALQAADSAPAHVLPAQAVLRAVEVLACMQARCAHLPPQAELVADRALVQARVAPECMLSSWLQGRLQALSR